MVFFFMQTIVNPDKLYNLSLQILDIVTCTDVTGQHNFDKQPWQQLLSCIYKLRLLTVNDKFSAYKGATKEKKNASYHSCFCPIAPWWSSDATATKSRYTLGKCSCHARCISYILMIPHAESISREQFESLQKDVASLQRELNYWQNTTINILKNYLLENEGII